MTSTTEAPTRREENRAARQERRAMIIRRWDVREATRRLAQELERSKEAHWVADWLIALSTMENVTAHELVWSGGFEMYELENIVAHLVRVVQLKEMPYDEYLQTPEWKRRATRAKKDFRGACALDAPHPAEHAHHRTYTRRGREFQDDLIPLCAACHKRFHGDAVR